MKYLTVESLVGNTPLVKLQHLANQAKNTILLKLEGTNPAGSVKDRPALNMINQAEARGEIQPGDSLIEATSGNTGIALAMAATLKGYHMILVMPETMSAERRASMKAYGAELVLTPTMEDARDLAVEMANAGKGKLLDQFSNPDNPQAHYKTTAPEIWQATEGKISHFVSAMGTTGTIMGVGTYLKQQNPEIQILGIQPLNDDEIIPGIKRWEKAYLPKIFDPKNIDQIINITQAEAEKTMHLLAEKEGVFCGISSGGAVAAALKFAKNVQNATIVVIICDRGDRYISTGVFPA